MPLRILTRPGLHTTGFYVAYFMAMGAHLPFWPLWLRDWGLSPAEAGAFTAIGMGVRVVAGILIPAIADRLDARRHTIVVCTLVCVALFPAHLWIQREATLLAATLVVGAMMAGIGPIGEALGAAAARAHDFAYAQSRGLGSLGFLAANLAIGTLVISAGAEIVLWWIVACLILSIALIVRHPGGRRVQGQIPPKMREIGRLVVNPVFAIFLVTVAMTQASHAVFYAFGSIHWQALGLSEGAIGGLWAVSVATEIVFMVTIGTWTIQVLGPVRALALSGLAGVLRWGAMMLDPVGLLLWPLQGLHALTFAIGHLAAMAFISRAIPARFGASAQGAMGAMAVGLVLALAMALAAWVYPTLGGRTYGIGVALSALGLGFCALLGRRWRGETLAV